MLFLLRKIRRKLMSNNKVTTYLLYALGEIFLVVIGILIAVNINNWNDRINRDAEEQKILKSLSVELSYNIKVFDSIHDTHVQQSAAIYTIRDSVLANYSLNDLDSLFYTALSFYTYDPSEGVINSLLSSGNIDLLTNEELKYRVAKMGDLVEDYREDEDLIGDYVLTQIFPGLSDQLDSDYGYFYSNKERDRQQKTKDSTEYLNVLGNRIVRNQLNILGAMLLGGPLHEGPRLRSELVAIKQLTDAQIQNEK